MDAGPAGPTGPVPARREPLRPDATTRERVIEIFAGEGFRHLFATRVVSQLGDGLFQLAAAAVLLFEEPGENPALALLGVTAVALIPFSAISPFVGVFIDRWERRKILVWVPLVRAGVAALIPAAALLGKRGWAFYLVVLVVLSANRFFLATMSAVLPQLVPADDLLVANTAATTGGSVANVLGQAAGAPLSGLIGGTSASALASLGFAASALTARRVPVHRGFTPVRRPLREEFGDVVLEMFEGLRRVRGTPRVVYALSAIGAVQFLVGAMTAVLVYYFIGVLELEVSSATAILALLVVGIGAGVLTVPAVARRVRHDRLIPFALAIGAGGNLIAAAWFGRAAVLAGTILAGISYAFAKIPVDTIVQEEMADVVRGRAFAVYDMLFNVARVAGVAAVALAYQAGAASQQIVWVIGAAYLTAAMGFSAWERRREMGPRRWFRRRRPRAPRPDELLVPGEIVTVRAYAGGRADEEPRAIVVGGRDLPIEAVDWRAVVEERGMRKRAFVVRVAGRRVRLSIEDDTGTWQIERVMPLPPDAPAS